VRFASLRLPTRRPDDLLSFYTNTFGLQRNGNGVRAGETLVEFEPGDAPPQHFAFNVPENQLDEAKAWVEARLPLLAEKGEDLFHFDAWDAHAIYFRDSGGNVVELIARHTLSNASEAPFGGAALLEVSEIGLPTADVPAAVASLERALGASIYSGDRTMFSAVGDEHGLFIVVPEGRPWFPTDIPAETAPLEVTVVADLDASFAPPGTAVRVLGRAG
jgi:catechol-2,3-dioxygenase